MNPNKRVSILYIPHGGGPMPLLSEDGYERMNPFLREFPSTIPEPEVIVVISAHWEEPVVSITAHKNPPMLYDYKGFPPRILPVQLSSTRQTKTGKSNTGNAGNSRNRSQAGL